MMSTITGTPDKAKNKSVNQTGVLMVHGIQGSPIQFSFLAKALPTDIMTIGLLLPGHGAGVSQFRRSGQEMWLSSVVNVAREMRSQCSNLIFVGHSMGCLLGLLAEQETPGLFDSMILLCCPFSLRLTFRYLKNNVLSFQKEPVDPYVLATKEANSVSVSTPFAYIFCLHPYMELLRLIRRVRKMEFPSAPAYYFFSCRDEIVSPGSAVIAKEYAADRVHFLENCGHQYFTEEAKQEIINTLLKNLRL